MVKKLDPFGEEKSLIFCATDRHADISKTVFRIFDPVDIYATLQSVSDMKPLVKDPNVTLEQLVQELNEPNSLNAPGIKPNTSHAHDVLSVISQRVMRILRQAGHKADKKPELKKKLQESENLWGVAPDKLHQHLHALGPQQAANFVNQHQGLLYQLHQVKSLIGSDNYPVLADHHDELQVREQNYGDSQKPADYLSSFNDFIRQQLNQPVALSVVVNKPKDLTREQLKEIRLLLDQNGYSEASLKSAWRHQTNQDIAAGIVGYIRQAVEQITGPATG